VLPEVAEIRTFVPPRRALPFALAPRPGMGWSS